VVVAILAGGFAKLLKETRYGVLNVCDLLSDRLVDTLCFEEITNTALAITTTPLELPRQEGGLVVLHTKHRRFVRSRVSTSAITSGNLLRVNYRGRGITCESLDRAVLLPVYNTYYRPMAGISSRVSLYLDSA